jgi:hypothetical protein
MEAVFWADSCQLPVLSGRNRAESIGKNFRPELPGTGCFRAGLFDLGHDETLKLHRYFVDRIKRDLIHIKLN